MKQSGKFNFTKTTAVHIEMISAGSGREKNNDGMGYKAGVLETKMPDAPADDRHIDLVFMTVSDIKVDGRSVSGFEGPTTKKVLALQNGKIVLLLKDRFKAGSYNSFTLELDFEADGDGNSPGAYIKKLDKTKKAFSRAFC